MRTPTTSLLLPFLPLCAVATANAQGSLALHGEIVLAVGDPVAAVPGAVISSDPFDNVDTPAINRDGTIVFRAHFVGGGAVQADDRAYFLGRTNGDLQMVVRAGDQAVGCPPGTLLRNSVSSQGLSSLVRISPTGDLLFFASNLYDPSNPSSTPAFADSALFWGPATGLVLLAREGDPVPFLSTGEVFGQLALTGGNGVLNDNGTVLFATTLTGGSATASTDGVLVTGQPGSLTAVLREGDVLPTGEVVVPATGATNLSSINYLNAAGQVLHEIAFSTSPPSTATIANNRALAIWTPGSGRVVIAREGQQAPGLASGVLFGTSANNWTPTPVGNGNFTDAGQTLLNAQLVGGGASSADDEALYFGGIGGWSLVLRKGATCPGLTGGERFGSVGSNSMSCNNGGQLAFLSDLTGPGVTAANDTATWLGTPGNLQLLAREGDLVPGLAPGPNGPWRYGNMTAGPETPNLDDRGFVLFENTISDGTTTRPMWFGYTPERGVTTILAGNDTFTTGLGTAGWTTISTSVGSNAGDGNLRWFTRDGDFVAKLITPAPTIGAIVRGHLGSLIAEPSSVPATGGTQNFHLDLGPTYGNHLYVTLASSLGTSPGFASPLGPQTIPLNFDPFWTQLSLDLANSVVWPYSLWFTDATGKPFGAAPAFSLPPGFASLQGTVLHHAVVVLDPNTLASVLVTEPAGVRIY